MNKTIPQYVSMQNYVPFLFHEFKKGCELYSEGKSLEEIYELGMQDNYFDAMNIKRRQRYASNICKRLEVLDTYIIKSIVDNSSEVSRLLALYALMKTDDLFFEFMYEVYQQKLILRQEYIETSEMLGFMREKAMESETVANWSDATIKRLLSGYRNSMFEGGIASKDKNKIKVMPGYLPETLKEHLVRSGDEKYVKAMLGDR